MLAKIKHYWKRIKEGKLEEIKASLKWIYGYGKKHIFLIVLYTLIGLSGIVISLISSLVSRDLIDVITGHNTGELLNTFILMISIQLTSFAVNSISQYVSTAVNLKVDNAIKADLYSKIMCTEWESLTQYHSGDLLVRWSGDSSTISNGLLTMIPNAIMYIFKFASALWMVCREDASFAIFALVSAPVTFIVSRRSIKRMQKTGMGNLQASTKLNSFIQESFGNSQTIKAFDLVPVYINRISELQNDLRKSKLSYQKHSALNAAITTLLSIVVTYSTYGWGVYKVWSGAITYGTMTMFLSLSSTLSGSVQSMINLVPSTVALTNAAQRLMAIDSLPKEDYSHRDEFAKFAEAHSSEGLGLAIRDVAFTYKSGTEVFEHVTIDAHPHESIALVGPSGEGKTTMLRLILSIINPEVGRGYICPGNSVPENSEECMELSASSRQLFAYVPQGNTMFSGTIAENMRNVKADATDEEIIDALKLACAWDFVERLPDNINAPIQEHGGGFSEGQAQRLSIARALLKNAPLLLLDEATSALDIHTERAVLKNIMADSYPRTTIVTTHRPSVLNVCNRVYAVRNNGCDLLGKEEIADLVNGNS